MLLRDHLKTAAVQAAMQAAAAQQSSAHHGYPAATYMGVPFSHAHGWTQQNHHPQHMFQSQAGMPLYSHH